MIIVSTITFSIYILNLEFSQISSYVALAAAVIAIYSFFHGLHNKRNKTKEILELEVFPTISTLITHLEASKKFSEKQIKDIFIGIDGDLEKLSNFNSIIILIAYRYSQLIEVDLDYLRPYSLALAYELVEIKKSRLGRAAEQIDTQVRKNFKIKCGEDIWSLEKDEVSKYIKFSEVNNLPLLSFNDSLEKIKDIDPEKVEEKRKKIQKEANEWILYLNENESKFNKLLGIIRKNIPDSEFLKILSNLETDIVLISEQGLSDQAERAKYGRADTGKKYIDEALEQRGLKLGKLNNAVSLAFLNDITKGKDPIFFDLEAWGKQVEKDANELRKVDKGDERKFNFVMLQSSLHQLLAFGDELGKQSKIKIDSETLKQLGTRDTNLSTLITISKILREHSSTSLGQLIDKNLEYLDGIYDSETAKKISEKLASIYKKQSWTISDFVRHSAKKEDFDGLGLNNEQITKILEEAKILQKVLSTN